MSERGIRWAAALAVAACWFVAGLALTRLLFEWRFPAWLWLGRPLPVIAVGLLAALAGVLVWRRFGARVAVVSLPLLLNLVWLVDPVVDLARSRFLFAAGLWLAAVVATYLSVGDDLARWRRLGPRFVLLALWPVYWLTMSFAVGEADTFEFQVVAPQLGIAHPTGYPLYLLLGKLFTLLPIGDSVAGRLNFASTVYATLAAIVVFRLALELLRRPLPALVGAVALGLTPIFWSQAIIAEVYALHALIVAAALWLMVRLNLEYRRPTADRGPPTTDYRPQTTDFDLSSTTGSQQSAAGGRPSAVGGRLPATERRKTIVALSFVIGLGLTNHLTTVFLLPPAAVAVALTLLRESPRDGGAIGRRWSAVGRGRSFLPGLVAFTLPLLLYAYLPLRWRAVNDEPMGLSRFIDWVIGGRFQGALQLGAWLRDPARWEIVGRLLLDAWGWVYLALAVVGLAWLFRRQWRAALVLLVAAAGFTFYALNYYVPDLAVFLIPTHVVIAIWVASGAAALLDVGLLIERGIKRNTEFHRDHAERHRENLSFSVELCVSPLWNSVFLLLFMLPTILAVGSRWSAVDQSARDGGEPWARDALARPTAGAAILADSEKIAPLYYLQQAGGLRPDLDILVLPDEAAYRAELDSRLAAGQPVYLARFLPGLQGVYHLRSVGPLVEVSREPLAEPPADAAPADEAIGPLRLLGYRVEPNPTWTPAAAVTLYWTLNEPAASGEQPPTLHLRWASPLYGIETPVAGGQHPAGNYYPINAWRPGEVVADYHVLPIPVFDCLEADGCPLELQVAVAPRFAPAEQLEWTTVARLPVIPPPGPVDGQPFRAALDGFLLDAASFPAQVRPGTPLTIHYSGFRGGAEPSFALRAPDEVAEPAPAFGIISLLPYGRSAQYVAEVATDLPAGRYELVARGGAGGAALCGWLARPSAGCVLGEVEISGAPLPEGATNFADRIALLDVSLPQTELTPGGQLPLELTWQGLAPMSEDYTVFVQVLDATDRIVGQVDAWPVQGTFPTSQWTPGQVVRDPYVVQLSADLPPGEYRLNVGLYLLATLERLKVLDENGAAVDDRVEVGGLVVSSEQ